MRCDGKMFHSQITQSMCIKRSRESKIEPTVNARQGCCYPPKSACSIRTIPVPHGLMTILTAHKASSTGYILTNSDQNPIRTKNHAKSFQEGIEKQRNQLRKLSLVTSYICYKVHRAWIRCKKSSARYWVMPA